MDIAEFLQLTVTITVVHDDITSHRLEVLTQPSVSEVAFNSIAMSNVTVSSDLHGIDGLSAYQIWLRAGNTGTEAEFLASLVGPTVTAHGQLSGLLANDHPQYLQILARFAELDTEQARIEARQNLGLQVIDGGTF